MRPPRGSRRARPAAPGIAPRDAGFVRLRVHGSRFELALGQPRATRPQRCPRRASSHHTCDLGPTRVATSPVYECLASLWPANGLPALDVGPWSTRPLGNGSLSRPIRLLGAGGVPLARHVFRAATDMADDAGPPAALAAQLSHRRATTRERAVLPTRVRQPANAGWRSSQYTRGLTSARYAALRRYGTRLARSGSAATQR
jgi:hypothetical protein